jgi:hypothetical protein
VRRLAAITVVLVGCSGDGHTAARADAGWLPRGAPPGPPPDARTDVDAGTQRHPAHGDECSWIDRGSSRGVFTISCAGDLVCCPNEYQIGYESCAGKGALCEDSGAQARCMTKPECKRQTLRSRKKS